VLDCDRFRELAGDLLDESSDPTAGAHDFWLTRNGHGAGFWDGDWPEPAAICLTKASKQFGAVDILVGDNGTLYFN
ncbi:hypothetical protein LCGC14_2318420, partial [marine sediment metagenome]